MTAASPPSLPPRPQQHRGRMIGVGLVIGMLFAGALVFSLANDGDGPRQDVSTQVAVTGLFDPPRRPRAAETTTATTEVDRSDRFTMAFSGDLLPHKPLLDRGAEYANGSDARYDFDPMLAPMHDVIGGADLAICHMEVPASPDQDALTGYPAFGGPVELIDTVKRVGFDGCSTASNHSLDRGLAGISATLDRFDADGLGHAGTARSAEEGARITTYDVDGATVAHLSYSYGFNGYKIPVGSPFAVNKIDAERVKVDAARARTEGADLVVVSLHWGTEYDNEPDQYQRDIASLVLPSPNIDVVIGHHAHVVQPIEKVDGTWVIWGLGNQLANQPEVPRSDGLTALLTVERGPDGSFGVTKVEGVPTFIESETFRVLPVVATLGDPNISGELRTQLEQSYDRTALVLKSRASEGLAVAAKP